MRNGLLAAALVAVVGSALPAGARAAEVTVTSAADDGGAGTLRTLVADAGDQDTVVVPDPRTLTPPADAYELTAGEITVFDKDLTIKGAGADLVTIDGNETGRVFGTSSSGSATSLTLSGVTVTGGKVTNASEALGGGVLGRTQTSLTVEDSAVVGNVVDAAGSNGFGGGIGALGALKVDRVLVQDNIARNSSATPTSTSLGGGIWASGTATISSSTITGNAAVSLLGGGAAGGGVAASGGGTTGVSHSTLVANSAQGNLGTSGGNLSGSGGTITLIRSIVADGIAGNAARTNCDGATIVDGNNNVFDEAGGCTVNGFDSVVADPLLDVLGPYGGTTATFRVKPGSPAIDRLVGQFDCVAFKADQRLAPKPVPALKCDVGAYEAGPPVGQAATASGVGTTVATLHGSVTGFGPAGTLRFVYGTAADQLTSATPDQPLAPTARAIAVSAALTGLEPNRTYFYRLTATTPDGTLTTDPETFTTAKAAPAATTGDASSVTVDSAVLGGTVDPRGTSTSYRFEIGPDPSSLAPLPTRQAGEGRTPAAQTETVAGLTPGTTYAYRLVADNEGGTGTGEVKTFTTAPAAGGGATPTPTPTPVPTPTVTPPQPLTLTRLTLSPSRLKARFKQATIRFTLAGGTGVATVRFTVEKRGRRGKYAALKGSFSKRFTRNGATTYRWNGKVGGRRLTKGSYRLAAVATSSTGARTKAVRRNFRVR